MSRFVCCDFHVHSPESYDWPKDYKELDYELFPKESNMLMSDKKEFKDPDCFLNIYSKHEDKPSIVAITDHMRCGLSSKLSNKSLEQTLFFPGIELNVNINESFDELNIHILVIGPRNTTERDLWAWLKIGSSQQNTLPTDSIKFDNIKEFKERVGELQEKNCIVIPAHINQGSGIKNRFNRNDYTWINYFYRIKELESQLDSDKSNSKIESRLKKLKKQKDDLSTNLNSDFLSYVGEIGFDALQIKGDLPEKANHFIDSRLTHLTYVKGSDAHCVQMIGSEKTWVKVKKPINIFDIKSALDYPLTRVRLEKPGKEIYPKIIGLAIESSPVESNNFFLNNTDEFIDIPFSKDLNTLIGGRGSGKSALLESIAYAMENKELHNNKTSRQDENWIKTLKDYKDYKIEINELSKEGYLDNYPDHHSRLRRRAATLENSIVTLFWKIKERGQTKHYAIKRPFKINHSNKSEIWDLDEEEIKESMTTEDFNIEFFGWNEIESLGDKTNEQRKLLDKWIESHDFIQKVKENKRKLVENREKITNKLGKIKNISEKEEFERYDYYRKKWENINSEEVQSLFEEIDEIDKKINIINKSLINDLKDSLNKFPDNLEKIFAVENIKEKLVNEVYKKIEKDHPDVYSKLAEHIKHLKEIIKKIDLFYEEYSKNLEERKEEKKKSLEEENSISTSIKQDRENFKKKNNKAISLKNKLDTHIEKLGQLKDKRIVLLKKYRKSIEKLSTYRKESIAQVQKTIDNLLEKTEIKIIVSFNRQSGKEKFECFLNKAQDEYNLVYDRKPTEKKWGKQVKDIAGNIRLNNLSQKIRDLTIEDLVDSELGDKLNSILGDRTKRFLENIKPKYEEKVSQVDDWTIALPNSDTIKEEKLLMELEEIRFLDNPRILLKDKESGNVQSLKKLSPGQRCSALIPLIISQGENPLIIDQPEDNLDNKLLFDVVVKVLQKMKNKRQVIVATHNPNIPVSGDAEQVIVLEGKSSDKTEIVDTGTVDDKTVSDKIKTIMEGGEEAFRYRAKLYGIDFNKS